MVLGADKSGSVVAVAEVVAGLACLLLNEFLAMNALSIHSYESSHTVATVNVESLSHRTKTVSSIDIATVFAVVLQAPAELFGVRSVRILPVIVPKIVEIVDVSTLSAQYFTEHAMLSHIECAHFEPVVAAVFENHAVELFLLSQVNQFPALLEVHCRRHLICHVLAVLECTLSHDSMMLPVGSDVYEVDVGALAQLLISLLAIVNGSRSQSVLAQALVLLLCTLLYEVAKSNYFNTRDKAEVLYCTRTTHAKTNETDAYGLHLRQSQTKHVFLSGRTFGSFNNDFTLVPMPLGIGRERLCICCQASKREECSKSQT